MRLLSLNRPEPGQKERPKYPEKLRDTLFLLGRHPNDRVTSDPGVFSSTLPPAHNPTRPGRVTNALRLPSAQQPPPTGPAAPPWSTHRRGRQYAPNRPAPA